MKRFCSLLFFLQYFFLSAQEGPVIGGFRHITVKDGLPSSEIYRVIQDSKGYIWMCTDAGVCRYNGSSFQNFTTHEGLADNTIFRIEEASDGKIWTQGFSGALSFFDGKKFNPVAANDSLKIIYSNGQKVSYCMVTGNDGSVTTGGLYTNGCYKLIEADHYSHLHSCPSPIPIVYNSLRITWTDIAGNIFSYGSMNSDKLDGAFFHNDHLVTITFPEAVTSATNNRMLVTKDNRLLYSFLNTLYIIDGNGRVTQKEFAKTIIGLNEDKEGNIWVAFYYGGVDLFTNGDLNAEEKIFFPGKTVGTVFEDNEGGFWFATVGEGLYYRPDIQFGYLTASDGIPANTILSLSSFGKNKVLLGLPNATVTVFSPDESGNKNFKSAFIGTDMDIAIEAMISSGDSVFLSGNRNLILDSNLKTIGMSKLTGHEKGITRNPVNGKYFLFSHSDIMWCERNFSIDSIQLTSLRFTSALYTHDGTLWLGALNGLWKMGKSVPEYYSEKIKDLQVRIDAMCEDESGNLWISTRGEGVIVMNGDKRFFFNTSNGLPSNICRTITIDPQNRIWVGTNNGLAMISNFNSGSGKADIRNFNITNGLLTNEVKLLLVFDNKIWIGSNDGLCWINMDLLVEKHHAPPVYISSVRTAHREYDLNQTAEFNYGDEAIRVFLDGLEFRDPAGLKFRYRLAGGDEEEWLITSNREITFSGLAPGQYSLEVFAMNGDGTISKQPAVFHFIVHPPIWRTWWFILLSLIVIVSFIWYIAMLRTKQLRRRKEEKIRTEQRMSELRLSALRAQMNPHFIFNAINSIQHFILKNDTDQAYSYLSKFSRLIRLVLDQSRSDLVPVDQETDILKLYVELEKLRFERTFRFDLEVDPWLAENNIRLPGMLIQPFVENSIWHGLLPKQEGEALINVKLKHEKGQVIITIEDNGVGRRVSKTAEPSLGSEKRKSHGMKITEERLQLNDRSGEQQPVITITDLKDLGGKARGTKVEIRVSFEKETDANE
ncbi:MAG: histidine kinase [Bacteroidetes bacterium]|nr:histidine kinase [Bacteroidota bacterium]